MKRSNTIRVSFIIVLAAAILMMGVLLEAVLFGPGSVESFAAKSGKYTVKADDEAYTYSVLIYSGKEGTFGSDGKTVIKKTGFKYGDKCTIDADELDLKVKDSEKYYVRGLKLAGHDNDEISNSFYQSYTFDVKEDLAFSVAYGVKGGMVKYTVDYVDTDGKKLIDSDVHYGMPGDKPVVSYRYIKDYIPEISNAMKTLTDNEDDNHFVFTYKYNVTQTEVETPTEEEDDTGDEEEGDGDIDDDDDDDDDGRTVGAGATGPEFPGAAGGQIVNGDGSGDGDSDDGDSDGDSNTGDVTDLDNDETPLADGDKDQDSFAGSHPGLIAGVIGLIAFLIMLILFFLKKKKSEE